MISAKKEDFEALERAGLDEDLLELMRKHNMRALLTTFLLQDTGEGNQDVKATHLMVAGCDHCSAELMADTVRLLRDLADSAQTVH